MPDLGTFQGRELVPARDLQRRDLAPQSFPRTWWLLLVAVAGLAFAFRYYQLGDMPPGLHCDEAFNGIDVAGPLGVPLRQWPIFFTGNFGREPLFKYILADATALFGPGLITLRLVWAPAGAVGRTGGGRSAVCLA